MPEPHKNSSGLLSFQKDQYSVALKYPKYPLLVIKCHSSETSKCPLIPSAIVSSLRPCGIAENPATEELIPGSKSECFRTLLYLFWLICVLPCLLLNILNVTPNVEFHIAFPPGPLSHPLFLPGVPRAPSPTLDYF